MGLTRIAGLDMATASSVAKQIRGVMFDVPALLAAKLAREYFPV